MLRWSDFALSFYGQWPAPGGFVLWTVGLERFPLIAHARPLFSGSCTATQLRVAGP